MMGCSAETAHRSTAVKQPRGRAWGQSTKGLHSPHVQTHSLCFQDRKEKKNFRVTCVLKISRHTFKLIWQLFCHSWYKAKGTEWHRTELRNHYRCCMQLLQVIIRCWHLLHIWGQNRIYIEMKQGAVTIFRSVHDNTL